MSDAQGRVVLITGAAKRIGRVLAETFAQAGYDVAIHANRSLDDAQRAAEHLAERYEVRAEAFAANLSEEAPTAALVDAVCERFGQLDGLVNNASNFLYDDVSNFAWDRAHASMAVNCWAPVTLACRLSAHVKARAASGFVVNFVDVKTNNPDARFLSYELSKCAVAASTLGLARALSPTVRVNAVAPGLTLHSGQKSEDDFKDQHTQNLLGEGPTPQDLADAALFLAKASKVTGETVSVASGAQLLGPNEKFYASLTDEKLKGTS
ncbi:MAG: SDR family oxidoreductase [Pseudomonadota bacterium]